MPEGLALRLVSVGATPGRRATWSALALAVCLAHLWGAEELGRTLQVADSLAQPKSVSRMEVSFVRELQQAEPPPAPAMQRPSPRTRPQARARPTEPVIVAAPLPAEVASAPAVRPAEPAAEPVASGPAPVGGVIGEAQAVVAAASAASDATASMPAFAAAGQAFEWPPSTRLSYTLKGYYRGPVEGSARVEWLREGERYQVHLDVAIGPSFAPLATRRSSSEGVLGEQGLHPQRYEEVTNAPLRETRIVTMTLDEERIVLADGRSTPRPPSAQDSASQFVQLTWLFSTRPDRLHVGSTVELPLALPRRVETWVYDVTEEQVLDTPAGRVLTYHVKPRRSSRRAGEMLVDTWIAPTLQYLPVRIRIEQDEETWADLLIDRLPQQAETRASAVAR